MRDLSPQLHPHLLLWAMHGPQRDFRSLAFRSKLSIVRIRKLRTGESQASHLAGWRQGKLGKATACPSPNLAFSLRWSRCSRSMFRSQHSGLGRPTCLLCSPDVWEEPPHLWALGGDKHSPHSMPLPTNQPVATLQLVRSLRTPAVHPPLTQGWNLWEIR